MYIVRFNYGMESYQVDRKEFKYEKDANDYYNLCLKTCKDGGAISVTMYRELKSYSIFNR